jgi:DNA-binding winged helix-turn-helix (wHTH) protein/Tol biopolymer transport system component
MDGATKNGRLIRFSVFEVDRESGELFKQGRKIKLQGQPFELLVILLDRPGEVLTREELRQKVWPTDTAGDFDHGLNRAVNKVREALGDSAETPRFIETVPRRGYRFIGPIQPNEVAESPIPQPAAPEAILPTNAEPQAHDSKKRRKRWIPITIAAALVLATASIWFASHRASEKGPIQIQQLTTNSSENPIQRAAVSPDGKYLAYGDRAGIEIKLISTGESHLLPRPQGVAEGDIWAPVAWFPGETRLLASSVQATPRGPSVTAWLVSVIGGSAVPIRRQALAQSISPNGSLIAFTISRAPDWPYHYAFTPEPEIWVMGTRGENARKIIAGDESTSFGAVRWSPDGKRLAYLQMRSLAGMSVDYTIESCDLNGGTQFKTLSGVRQAFPAGIFSAPNMTDFAWLPDNRMVFPIRENMPSSRDTYLWQIDVDSRSGKPRSQPKRIARMTSLNPQGFTVGADGKKLAFNSGTYQSHVYMAAFKPDGTLTNPRRLTLDERYDFAWTWTPDSRAVIFTSDRTGTFALYKQALDQAIPELIPTGAEAVRMARVTPDGAWLIYAALSNAKIPDQSDSVRLMRVPWAGGAPELLFESKSRCVLNFSCPNRPGAQCLANEWNEKGHENAFVSFNAATGARHELFRTKDADCFNWTVSPDGSRIAAHRNRHIEIITLSGQIERMIELREWQSVAGGVDWAADGKTLFVSPCCTFGPRPRATLLRVGLDGNVKPIWESGSADGATGVASPDGRYLAITVDSTERNAWMIENF